jgi:hypothetical protein
MDCSVDFWPAVLLSRRFNEGAFGLELLQKKRHFNRIVCKHVLYRPLTVLAALLRLRSRS